MIFTWQADFPILDKVIQNYISLLNFNSNIQSEVTIHNTCSNGI